MPHYILMLYIIALYWLIMTVIITDLTEVGEYHVIQQGIRKSLISVSRFLKSNANANANANAMHLCISAFRLVFISTKSRFAFFHDPTQLQRFLPVRRCRRLNRNVKPLEYLHVLALLSAQHAGKGFGCQPMTAR